MDRPASAPVFIRRECLDALSSTARESPRRRKNLNFHAELSHPAQRLLNAVEPGSYIRPHRHSHPDRDETFVVVRGALGLVIFDDSGRVTHSVVLRANGDTVGGHVPSGTFHTLVSLEPGSIFFEAKAGPYEAITDKDFGPWSPPEGHPDVAAYLGKLEALFAGAPLAHPTR